MGTPGVSSVSQTFTSAELAKRTLQRRGVEAAIWGMPLVSVDAMRQALLRDAGASAGDILYLSKPADWRFQATTPNTTSLYAYFSFNLSNGPVAVEVPAASDAGIHGTFIDAWETPLADAGSDGDDQGGGGTYVLLPPGDAPWQLFDGHLPVHSRTVNGYGLFRFTPASGWPEDQRKAIDLVKKLRVYPLAKADSPPSQQHVDISGRLFEGVTRFDDSFYDALARMVHEEPVLPRDAVVMAQLRSLGIEKGKAFKPDAATREILKTAIAEAHALFMNAATSGQPYWPGSRWLSAIALGSRTGFSFESDDRLDIDERATTFFIADAVSKNGAATAFHLGAFRDGSGTPLKGDDTYRLRIPPTVPVKQSWAVAVYDLATAAFIRNAPRVAIDAGDRRVQKNADGSIDVYFAPTAPVSKESNWIYTAPRKPWFAYFHFHGPEKAVLERTWVLPNIERAR